MAQNMPERALVRKGNRQFEKERYERSVDSYTRALEAVPGCFEAGYNLSNALFRSERYDKAEQTLKGFVADSTRSDKDRADAYYNLGNTQFMQQKLQEALESYRNSLRLNPEDMEAKYPPRDLPEGAKVTRFAPSPTGFIHLGNLPQRQI